MVTDYDKAFREIYNKEKKKYENQPNLHMDNKSKP
jgi:hypothetical protein